MPSPPKEDTTTAARPSLPGVALRGMLMGAADIVPGVSGGTMAFITGIYARLLTAITAFDLGLLRQVLGGDFKAAWIRVDGAFLAALLAGILASVLTLARLISHLLVTQPLLLWSLFFGLILASALVILQRIEHWSMATLVGIAAGMLVAAFVGLSSTIAFPGGIAGFFLAGFLAICAMILPGISGSFILVLLGMYARVLGAIETFDVLPLAVFAAGAACGLLAFARLLRFLIERYHSPTMATLTGFLVGSLPVVWPWKGNAPDEVPAQPLWPGDYAALAGDSQLPLCVLCMCVGFLAVWLIENRWGGPER
jgi:putative membrane protein